MLEAMTTPSTELIVAIEDAATASRTPMWKRLLKDPQFVITAGILLLIFLMGVLTPLLTQQGPNDADLSMVNAPAGTPGYPLGADESGRDIWTRLLLTIPITVIR